VANGLYSMFKQRLLNKEINLSTDTVKAVLIDTTQYTVNLATNQNLADVPVAARVATVALTGNAITNGVFSTANWTWASVTGNTCAAIVLFDDTHASKALCAYYDTGITGFPVTPNGGNINVTENASGLFSL
jgi:hypothetical protein